MLNITAYHCHTTINEAVALLAEEGRTIIAGGTDLLVNPRYMVGVREVVDIRKLGLDDRPAGRHTVAPLRRAGSDRCGPGALPR